MVKCVALLRGVNVGGRARISMEELRKTFESMGLEKVRTYIQSGNVVFETKTTDGSSLVKSIETGIKTTFRIDVHVIIRTSDEISRVIEKNPFHARNLDKAHVTFLSAKPGSVPRQEIEEVKDDNEKFHFTEMEIYLHCPNGYGKSKLSNSLFERKLKVSATTRNWRTVNVIYRMMSE